MLDVFTGADDDVLRRLAVMILRAGELEDGQAYEQEIKASLTLSEVDEARRSSRRWMPVLSRTWKAGRLPTSCPAWSSSSTTTTAPAAADF